MREILFRGKRIDNGVWVYGSFLQVEHEDGSFTTAIFHKKDACGDAEVYPATIGQYTGLKDKNGKRIFEGDIVYVTGLMPHPTWGYDSVTGVVEWCGGAFEVEGKANDDYVPYGLLYDSCDACREIIGNIHDNPESRKEEQGTV